MNNKLIKSLSAVSAGIILYKLYDYLTDKVPYSNTSSNLDSIAPGISKNDDTSITTTQIKQNNHVNLPDIDTQSNLYLNVTDPDSSHVSSSEDSIDCLLADTNWIIEILKTIRFELQDSLMSISAYSQQLQNTELLTISQSKQQIISMPNLSRCVSNEYIKVCKVFGITRSELKYKTDLLGASNKRISSLANQIKQDIENAYIGIFTQVGMEIPNFLSPCLCLEIMKDVFMEAYRICEETVNYFAVNRGNCRLNSNEFIEIAEEMERESRMAKYDVYAKYNLTDLEAPSATILQIAIQKYCEESLFREEMFSLESEFKGKTEIALSMIR